VSYNGKYATVRFYDAPTKESAKYYGVLSTWYQITATPVGADTIPRPTTADQIIFMGNPGDRVVADIPAVPEPTSMALVGLGSLAMLIRRKMRKDA
jgi:hypothetical protein